MQEHSERLQITSLSSNSRVPVNLKSWSRVIQGGQEATESLSDEVNQKKNNPFAAKESPKGTRISLNQDRS